MIRSIRNVTTTALVTSALSSLCGPGCGPRNDAILAGPDKLVEAQRARGDSFRGEAGGGPVKTARRR
jgi:hypothetical protein